MLKTQLKTDLDSSLKQQDKVKLMVLRNIWSLIRNREIDLKKDLEDKQVIDIIKKEVKGLKEASVLFEKGGREDLVLQNDNEIKILSVYLPKEISDEELAKKIEVVISKNSQITNKGQLIGLCISNLKDIADSSRIAKYVQNLKEN